LVGDEIGDKEKYLWEEETKEEVTLTSLIINKTEF